MDISIYIILILALIIIINYNRFNENKIYIKTLLIIISNNGYKIKKDRDSKGRYLIIKDIITNGIK